jgi:hypothetical protein
MMARAVKWYPAIGPYHAFFDRIATGDDRRCDELSS